MLPSLAAAGLCELQPRGPALAAAGLCSAGLCWAARGRAVRLGHRQARRNRGCGRQGAGWGVQPQRMWVRQGLCLASAFSAGIKAVGLGLLTSHPPRAEEPKQFLSCYEGFPICSQPLSPRCSGGTGLDKQTTGSGAAQSLAHNAPRTPPWPSLRGLGSSHPHGSLLSICPSLCFFPNRHPVLFWLLRHVG